MEEVTLRPRRSPSQDRGRRRVTQILDAVAQLLIDNGFDAITTRLIAERADIPVGSIYQFFPNKYAIFKALAERYLEGFIDAYRTYALGSLDSVPWDQALDQAVDGISQVVYSDPAVSILWAGMRNSPELNDTVALHAVRGYAYNAALLERALPDLSNEKRELMAWVMGRVLETLLTEVQDASPERKQEVIEEAKFLLKCYVRARVQQS